MTNTQEDEHDIYVVFVSASQFKTMKERVTKVHYEFVVEREKDICVGVTHGNYEFLVIHSNLFIEKGGLRSYHSSHKDFEKNLSQEVMDELKLRSGSGLVKALEESVLDIQPLENTPVLAK